VREGGREEGEGGVGVGAIGESSLLFRINAATRCQTTTAAAVKARDSNLARLDLVTPPMRRPDNNNDNGGGDGGANNNNMETLGHARRCLKPIAPGRAES